MTAESSMVVVPVSADAHVNEPHNLWYERPRSHPERIKLAGLIPTWDVVAAVEGVQRVADLGFASAIVPLT